jgi:hypothetical protein
MCGKEINLEKSLSESWSSAEAEAIFDHAMKLSSIRMYDDGEFIECAEQNDHAFYFHSHCAKALLRKNHFNWLKGDGQLKMD